MLLFDSLVFSAGDREATYLLNGLVNTSIVDSDVHASDSHGATEPVFASTYLTGIHFEPRIKRLLYQQFYSIDPLSQFKDQNYPLTPRGRINSERIKAEWDTILRLMVTIKLHHSPPSELFNRLNSYAHLHPIYQGLREFERSIKTIFLLRYTDQIAGRIVLTMFVKSRNWAYLTLI
jgi:TnpA family transposase